MLLQLAWRNLWRNRRRTLITLSALTLGIAAIVGLHGYRTSTFLQLERTITTQLVGDFQIHARGYQASPELSATVAHPDDVIAAVASVVVGSSVEARVVGAGLGGTHDNSSGVFIMGVTPGAGMGDLDILRGRAFGADASRSVVIGVDLADQLALDVGGELVLVGQAKDGSVANDRYTVVGVADGGTAEYNATAVFMNLKDAQAFFGLDDGVHQLIVHLDPTRGDDLKATVARVRAALDGKDLTKDLEALSWNELMPELTGTIAAKQRGQYSLDFIIFVIVALGVLNAMTMSTFERTREFGVMLALGTRPRRILGMVVVESLLQGAIGLCVGVAIAAFIFFVVGDVHFGEFSRGDMLGVRLPATVHLRISSDAVISAAVTAFSTMVAGGFLPALRASRLPPVDAMRPT